MAMTLEEISRKRKRLEMLNNLKRIRRETLSVSYGTITLCNDHEELDSAKEKELMKQVAIRHAVGKGLVGSYKYLEQTAREYLSPETLSKIYVKTKEKTSPEFIGNPVDVMLSMEILEEDWKGTYETQTSGKCGTKEEKDHVGATSKAESSRTIRPQK